MVEGERAVELVVATSARRFEGPSVLRKEAAAETVEEVGDSGDVGLTSVGEEVVGVMEEVTLEVGAGAGLGERADDDRVDDTAFDALAQEFSHREGVEAGLKGESEGFDEFGASAGGGFVVTAPEETRFSEAKVDAAG